MYRISWISENGTSGSGQYCLTLEQANSWVETLIEKYPYMQHWVEDEKYPETKSWV